MKLYKKITDECLACLALIVLLIAIPMLVLYNKLTNKELIQADGSI